MATPPPYLACFVRVVDRILSAIVAIIVFIMMVAIVADAVGRAFHRPLSGAVEITEEYLLITIVFLGLGYAHRRGSHIRVEVFGKLWPWLEHHSIQRVMSALGAMYFALMAWAAAGQTAYAWSVAQRSASELAYPMAPAYALVVIGSAVMCLWLVLDAVFRDVPALDPSDIGEAD